MTDTDKLELIKEHAKDYYVNERKYHFVTDGFVNYEIFDTPEGKAIYFAEIFVSKSARGGITFKELIEFCRTLEHTENAVIAYARTQFNNPHLESMKSMYIRSGWSIYREDEDAMYFVVDKKNVKRG